MTSKTTDKRILRHHRHGYSQHGRGRMRNHHIPPVADAYTLDRAQEGQVVRVKAIQGGRCLRVRLAELGIAPGSTVRVVQSFNGPIIVAVKEDARMAIGRRMAAAILIENID